MSAHSPLPTFVSHSAKVAAFVGMLIGIGICYKNDDTFLWACLKIGLLGLSFAYLTRRLAIRLLRAWLETKLEIAAKEREIADKEATKNAAKPPDDKKDKK